MVYSNHVLTPSKCGNATKHDLQAFHAYLHRMHEQLLLAQCMDYRSASTEICKHSFRLTITSLLRIAQNAVFPIRFHLKVNCFFLPVAQFTLDPCCLFVPMHTYKLSHEELKWSKAHGEASLFLYSLNVWFALGDVVARCLAAWMLHDYQPMASHLPTLLPYCIWRLIADVPAVSFCETYVIWSGIWIMPDASILGSHYLYFRKLLGVSGTIHKVMLCANFQLLYTTETSDNFATINRQHINTMLSL